MNTSRTPGAAGRRFKIALLVLTGSLGAAMAANAAPVDNGAPSLVVRYSAESLTTDSGVQQLYRRILGAAKQVCPEASVRDLKANAQVEACRAQAVAHAVQHIDNTRLAALYATSSKSG